MWQQEFSIEEEIILLRRLLAIIRAKIAELTEELRGD